MSFAYAGKYQQVLLDQNGNLATGVAVTVFLADGVTLATLYTDQTMAATAANPVSTDAVGNLVFFTQPGSYIFSATLNGVLNNTAFEVLPWPTDLLGGAISAGNSPWFQYWVLANQGPLANATNYTIQLATFTLTRAAILKMKLQCVANWSANQALNVGLSVDGTQYGPGFAVQNVGPVTYVNYDVPTPSLAAGTHTLDVLFGVGGGGSSISITNLYAEILVAG